LRHVDVNAERDVRMGAPHRFHPIEQKGLPKTDLASNRQNRAMTFGYRNLLSRALP